MRKHYDTMVRFSESKAAFALKVQIRDESSPCFGAFPQPDGVCQAKSSMYAIGDLATVYIVPESRYYRDDTLLKPMEAGFDYVERVQRDNGLFDYVTCNFLSAPDTAFCLMNWIPHITFLRGKKVLTPGKARILSRMEKITFKAARGLPEGGFHTPNHRWAIASVLCWAGKTFGDESLTRAAGRYLIEGIDCNEDGEYSEKSAGNYNNVNNSALMLLADSLEDPSYHEHVIRNLRMMLTYWEPDDSVFTANSTRYDKDRLVYPTAYYFKYLDMGIRYDIPEFVAMANHIFGITERKRLAPPDCLMEYLLHPDYIGYESEQSGTPTGYEAFYPESAILRVRRDRYTFTLMGGKSAFLTVHNGVSRLTVKLAGSFCEHRAFIPESLTREEDGTWVLRQTMRGWYYLPFREKPATSDWWKMDNDSREKKLGPDMDIEVRVRETKDGLTVRFITRGVEGAPWRVELAFDNIDRIDNPHLTMPVHGDEVLVLKSGDFTVSRSGAAMTVGPAFGVHHFTEGKEDSEGKKPGAATVYLTDYTAFDHTVTIRPDSGASVTGLDLDMFR